MIRIPQDNRQGYWQCIGGGGVKVTNDPAIYKQYVAQYERGDELGKAKYDIESLLNNRQKIDIVRTYEEDGLPQIERLDSSSLESAESLIAKNKVLGSAFKYFLDDKRSIIGHTTNSLEAIHREILITIQSFNEWNFRNSNQLDLGLIPDLTDCPQRLVLDVTALNLTIE